MSYLFFSLKKFWMGTDTLVMNLWFQTQSGQPCLHFAEAYVLHVNWDSPLVWHLPTSWQPTWQPSESFPCTCEQALVGLKSEIYCATDECSTNCTVSAGLLFMPYLFFLSFGNNTQLRKMKACVAWILVVATYIGSLHASNLNRFHVRARLRSWRWFHQCMLHATSTLH